MALQWALLLLLLIQGQVKLSLWDHLDEVSPPYPWFHTSIGFAWQPFVRVYLMSLFMLMPNIAMSGFSDFVCRFCAELGIT